MRYVDEQHQRLLNMYNDERLSQGGRLIPKPPTPRTDEEIEAERVANTEEARERIYHFKAIAKQKAELEAETQRRIASGELPTITPYKDKPKPISKSWLGKKRREAQNGLL